MQNHNDDTIKTCDTVLRKIYLTLYMKGLCVRGSWRPNRTATYWPPLLWPSAFLSRSPGLLNRGSGGPASLAAGFLYRIISPTRLISNCWLLVFTRDYIMISRPLFFLRASQSHSFNPSTVKVIISWYSSTGCTCYTGAFPILTARPGRRSKCNNRIIRSFNCVQTNNWCLIEL